MPAPKDPAKREEWRRKLVEAGKKRKGWKHTEETKAKIGRASKGKTSWIKGKKLTEEHKQKISNTLLGHEVSEVTRQKISQRLKIIFQNHSQGKR
jgi:hypothetical protein